MKKIIGEFKTFITRGNVVDMAVGVIIGGAFTGVVNGLSNYILKPIINWILALIIGKDGLSGAITPLSMEYKWVEKLGEDGQALLDADGNVIMEQVYDYAGQFLANVSCATNPDTIVLGGEFCRIGKPAVEGIAKYFKKYVFHANENVRFQLSVLGTDASIYGAFKMVLDAFGK